MTSIRSDPLRERVSVIGAACRMPNEMNTPDDLWRFLASTRRLTGCRPGSGRFGNRDIPASGSSVLANYLDRIDLFDAAYFGISPREAIRMDPQHRMFLELAIEALENANLPAEQLAGQSVGVFIGIYRTDYAWLPEAMDCPPDVHSATGGGAVFAANRLSHVLDLRGPSMAVDTTCSSSLVATHLAVSALRAGECDLAIVGGVNLILSPDVAASSEKAIPASWSGRCESFASGASGAVMAEGGVALILERATEAQVNGHHAIANILGSAVNHDGQASSLTSPNPAAQSDVICAAFERAGLSAERLAYIEAHGTGTEVGDAIEIEGVAAALKRLGRRGDPVEIGSIKAQLGHLEAAAGAAGLLRACMSLERGVVTPHPLDGRPHSLFDDVISVRPAIRGLTLGTDSLVGVSAFSLGGTNAHIVLGPGDRRMRHEPGGSRRAETGVGNASWVVPFSARSAAALSARVEKLIDALDGQQLAAASVADIAHTASVGRSALAHRLAVIASDRSQLRDGLGRAAARLASGKGCRPSGASHREIVFVLPGHGSQWPGMAEGLLGTDANFDAAVARLDEAFRPYLRQSVAELLAAPAPPAALRNCAEGQPALFTMQIALAELFRARGVTPSGLLAYSAGELAGMVLSGMLDEADAVRLCAARSAMATPEGAMLAVRLPERDVRIAMERIAPELALAAVNGPETTIVSGPAAAIARLAAALDAEDVLCIDAGIPYSFHHPVMADAAMGLRELFEDPSIAWRDPVIPLYSSTLGGELTRQGVNSSYWRAAACDTLRFDRACRAALDAGFHVFLEIAPSAALTGDCRDTIAASGCGGSAIPSLRRGVPPQRALAAAAAELFEAGAIASPRAFNPALGSSIRLPAGAWDPQSFWWPAAPQPKAAPAPAAAGRDPRMFGLKWQRDSGKAARSLILSAEALSEIDAITRLRADREGLRLYASHEAEIDRICGGFACAALAELAGSDGSERPLDPEALARGLSLDRAGRRLLGRLIGLASGAGFLRREGMAYRIAPHPAPADLLRDLGALSRKLPAAAAELGMLARTGPHIAAVQRGTCDALQLLFPDAAVDDVADIFGSSGIAAVMNAIAGDAARQVLAGFPAGSNPRVVEVGAGTGGTSASLIPHMLAAGGSYLLTDISRTLLRFAKRRFAGVEGVATRRLDIASDPGEQGFGTGEFDLAICANVLHASPDVKAALLNVRSLLAPGGTLLLVEAVAPQPLVDVTFGLTRDWWGYDDVDRRPDHPLLSRAAWRTVLAEAGFRDIQLLPNDEALADELGCAVIVARAAGVTCDARARRHWVVIGADNATRAQVASALAPEAASVTVDETGRVMAGQASADGPCGVVDLRPLQRLASEQQDSGELMAGFGDLMADLLTLARHLAGRRAPPPLLVMPTLLAHAAGSAAARPDPMQAAFGAVCEAMAAEHPDWDVRGIDCACAAPAAVAAAVRAEALCEREGVRPRYDGVRRSTARLESISSQPTVQPSLDPDRLFVVTGGLGALGLEVADWLAERGARRILLAQRSRGKDIAAARIARLEQLGIDVALAAVDLAEPAAAAEFAAAVAASPAGLGGIVHSAGVFSDGVLISQDWQKFRTALAPKLVGGWELYRALSGADGGFMIFCGSCAGLLQPSGVGNYAAGNAFLGALASRARGFGINATSISWGGWSDLGMAARQTERWLDRWRRMGVEGLSREDLRAALDFAAAGAAPSELWVMNVDWARYRSQSPPWRQSLLDDLRIEPAADIAAAADPPPASSGIQRISGLETLPPPVRRRRIAGAVRSLSLRILELADHYDLEEDLPLADLGLDSLLALELRTWLCEAFDLELQPTLLLDCPTAGDLISFLDERIIVRSGRLC